MLGKLIKYELKATSRWFLPIYVLALLLAPVERFMIYNVEHLVRLPAPFDKIFAILLSIVSVAFVLVLVAIGAASVLLIIYRFYKNLITNEGYLMHTLPVKTSQLIWSKAIAAVIWSLVSVVVIGLAILCLAAGTPGWNNFISAFPEQLSYILSESGANRYAFKLLLELFLMAATGIISGIFMLYASISLGQLVTKHKILGAFGAYFILNMAVQFLSTAVVIPFILRFDGGRLETLDGIPDLMTNVLFPGCILFTLLLAAGFYFITSYVFKNKLNLE